jgi:translation initiation factor IF-2
MAETISTPRLMAAAKEFNIGKDTLVDFLVNKGFDRDELKPTAKLTEAMYRALQNEFQSDKVAKLKAVQIDLPKGGEAKKKRDEEEVLRFRKEEKKPAPKEVLPPPPPVELAPPAPVAQEVAPVPEPVVLPVPEEKAEVPAEEPIEVAKPGVPEIEAPKVITKIDLSSIDSSTRPKKGIKKAKEADEAATPPSTPVVQEPAEAPAIEEPRPIEELPVPVIDTLEDTPVIDLPENREDEPVIENIKAEKLEGPKILGKIELPVENDTRPKTLDEKRKRKRIPIEKRGPTAFREGGQQGAGSGQGQQSTGQGGGGRFTPQKNVGGQQGGGLNRAGGGSQGGGGGRFTPQRRGDGRGPREDRQIDEKEIQRKIQETQAKLSGGGGRGNKRTAKRRDRRAEMAEGPDGADNKLQVTEFISVSELANLMDVSFAEVISKCMGLGIMVSINQRLDAEVIELVASEFGYDVEFIDMEKQLEMEEEDEEDDADELQSRSPIVTIMGHVDHGKTSLLDYIRKANVVAGEAGGITQHIGAYQVNLPNGKDITFLDTPGHEAFTAMRARGAKITDIAVIVIAADDAIMPQTREAISHAQAANVPMIFAINKIDKDGANPQKIYEQLAGMNILVEAWGGKFQSQELSAKQGLNVDLLLEKILLEAELLELKANPDREASGTIIEATLDKGRGYVATILVQNGTLQAGDLVVSGQHFGRVKAMMNERNKRIDEAGPSAPALILGLNGAPQAGEKFKVYEDEAEAKDIANRRAQILREQGMRAKKHITLDEIGRRLALGNFKELKVIIKGDVDGSVEALSDSLQKQSTEEILVSVIHKGVGQINESDVVLAEASDAIIIGFNVRPSLQANRLADNAGIEIKTYSIIYNAIEEIRSAMEGMLEPKTQEKIIGNVEIKEVFKFDKATVAGCQVIDGRIRRDSKIRLIRDGIVVYPTGEGQSAELGSLKRYKDDAKEVMTGMECGLTVKNYSDIKVGDIIEAYEEEEVKRTL